MNRLFPTIINYKPIKLVKTLNKARFKILGASLYKLPTIITVASNGPPKNK